MSSSSKNPAFDNLLLQSLTERLHIHSPPNLFSPLFLTQTLEDLLFDPTLVSDSDDDETNNNNKTQLAKEESKIEKEIIRTILGGKIETLKPNSGQAVSINEHNICVGFNQDAGSDYRVWEWHGHVILFDEEHGYAPEYIYGNYFERVKEKSVAYAGDDDKEKVEKLGSLGLRELIESGDSVSGRILQRNVNARSPRF